MREVSPNPRRPRRLGLVSLAEMTRLLVSAVENLSRGARLIDVPQIRAGMIPSAA